MLKRDTVITALGKPFADHLDRAVLSFGKVVYSRRQLVEELGCANFIAAARLQKALRTLRVATVEDLWQLDPIDLARVRGIGAASIFVAMCILDANSHDPIKWWQWNDNVVKFSTFKHKAIARAKRRERVA